MRLLTAIAASALLAAPIAAGAAVATPVPASIYADPPHDRAHPPTTAALQIDIHGEKVGATFYLAAGAEPHPTVLLLQGLPGGEQNLDLAQTIRREGWNVLTLHYRGAWGNPGRYSIANSIEDAEAALAFVRDPATVEQYRLAPGRVVVIGHTLGGFLAAKLGAENPSLTGVGLLSAADVGGAAPRLAKLTGAQYAEIFGKMEGRAAGTDGHALIAEGLAHPADWSLESFTPGLAKLPTLIVTTNDDDLVADLQLGKRLKAQGAPASVVEIDSDEPFSDSRIVLQATVVRWLETLPGSPHHRASRRDVRRGGTR
jgi:pimeloyl-ACP methyl ester carboxylesterase